MCPSGSINSNLGGATDAESEDKGASMDPDSDEGGYAGFEEAIAMGVGADIL